LFETRPISLVRPVVRLEASALGLYPSSAAAFSTFLRIFNDTDAPSVKVRETAARDTPARIGDILQCWRHSSASPIVRPFTAGPLLISAQKCRAKARISKRILQPVAKMGVRGF
jgi:hypothetical protein